MSYGASIYSHSYNPPIASEVLHGISREQRWLPDTIMNSAPSRREIEAQLVMDRLLREYLTRKSPLGVSTASWRRVPLRQGHWFEQYDTTPDGGNVKRRGGLMRGLVHVIDDDASFRRAMERRLKHAGYEVATYASAQHLLDRLPSESVPSCILLDVQIPGLDGPALQSRLSELGSTLPIIFLTGHPDIPTTVRAIKAGANDFLTKPVSSDELLRAIERAIAHHEVTFGLKSKLDMVRARIATLTPREREVFELVVRGDTNKQVARALGCGERTIKAHRHRVMEKMQVQTLAELVSLAERIGVFESGCRTAHARA